MIRSWQSTPFQTLHSDSQVGPCISYRVGQKYSLYLTFVLNIIFQVYFTLQRIQIDSSELLNFSQPYPISSRLFKPTSKPHLIIIKCQHFSREGDLYLQVYANLKDPCNYVFASNALLTHLSDMRAPPHLKLPSIMILTMNGQEVLTML